MDFLCFETEILCALKWVDWVCLFVGREKLNGREGGMDDVVSQEEIVSNEILDS